ncbi:MAG TPA: SDR family oxidoreductase [Candidatus Binatia bacterium]|jgi:enoyl-[acyl-carrier protein] reductase III
MSPFDLTGKVALVTGGTRGLGRTIALELARGGARVHAGYFQNEAAAEAFRAELAEQKLAGATVKANLMTGSGVQAYFDHISQSAGKLDCLIYNAATGVHKPLTELAQRHAAAVWQVNVGAFLDLALKMLPVMPAGARIVAISSEGARRAVDDYGAVGSSKAALEALCRQMAVEWAKRGIGVNVVAPGLLKTDTLAVLPDAERRVRQEVSASPLGRLVSLEEVAQIVRFLCAPASAGIVGQTITVDGGKSISDFVRE